MTRKITLFDKLTMIVLLLASILWIYGDIGGWSYYGVLSLGMGVFYFLFYLFTKGKITGRYDPLPQGMLGYLVYWGALFTFTAMHLPLAMIQAYLTFFLFFAAFNRDYYFRIYQVFTVVCIAMFFLQEVSYVTTGIRISGVLTFLPIHGDVSMGEFVWKQAESYRSSSFFSEPSHFAQFLLPLFAYEIFGDKNKNHIFFALFIAAVLLLLRSGTALFCMASILVFLLPYYLGNGRHRIIGLIAAVAVIIVAGYYYVNSEMGAMLLERQGEMSMYYEGGSRSGFLRIWRGYFVYGDYSLLEKIIGCPNETAQLAHVYSSGMQMVETAELYFNSFQKILLNTGLIGVCIFIYIVAHIWKGNTLCGKAILAAFVTLSLVSAIYMSHTMILYMVLAESMKTAPESKFSTLSNRKVIKATI